MYRIDPNWITGLLDEVFIGRNWNIYNIINQKNRDNFLAFKTVCAQPDEKPFLIRTPLS